MISLKEKNTKRGKIQAKKKLGMEKKREITIAKTKYRAWNGYKERNEILKSYLRERRPNKWQQKGSETHLQWRWMVGKSQATV